MSRAYLLHSITFREMEILFNEADFLFRIVFVFILSDAYPVEYATFSIFYYFFLQAEKYL